ncbi:hypothetical protein ACQ4PT_061872 [Festuca glaucescens]
MKLTSFFGASPSSKKGKKTGKSAKSCSFGSTASSLSTSDESVATPRTVLPPSFSPSESGSGSGTTKKPAATLAVTRQELEVALRSVVSTEEELAAMLADAETTALALEGIAAAEAADEGELRDIFAVFDADGDGRISAEELRAVLASLGDDRCSVEDCRRMIGGVDTDGDGFVCFGEFTRMMMHLP